VIRQNFKLNGVEPELRHGIVRGGDEASEDRFHLAEASGCHRPSRRTSTRRAFGFRCCRSARSWGASTRAALVVDIEGGEADLFRSADLRSVRSILIELYPEIIGEAATAGVIESLRAAGFGADPKRSRHRGPALHPLNPGRAAQAGGSSASRITAGGPDRRWLIFARSLLSLVRSRPFMPPATTKTRT
jgi:hypothetical protein